MEGQITRKGSDLFQIPENRRAGDNVARYEDLINQNQLFFTIDLIKELLSYGYTFESEDEYKLPMADVFNAIIEFCEETGNKHFKWFAKMLHDHFDGIISYEKFHISSGKIEGLNQKIKTIRRMSYGLPDTEYFFLRIMDASRREYVRNPKSCKIPQEK